MSSEAIAFGCFIVAAVLGAVSWSRIMGVMDQQRVPYPTFGGRLQIVIAMHDLLARERDGTKRSEYLRLLVAFYSALVLALCAVGILVLRPNGGW